MGWLLTMLHRVLTALDTNSTKESFVVIANMIDWNSAFPRQCTRLGIESFIKSCVRSSLNPLLENYFQDRKMSLSWHGCSSVPRSINGGGPAGATLGILEYLAQSNNKADCVSTEDRFKFIDDLSILEIVNLLAVGLSSFDIKSKVPSDILENNKFILPQNLKSQQFLNQLDSWTQN